MENSISMRPHRGATGRKLFGSNVRSLRLAKGMSQEALADACNLHRTYIGSIERGERNISLDSMERIAAALNAEVSGLLRVAVAPSGELVQSSCSLDMDVGTM